eukprot:8852067-Karenia_brevis.AAC.1
MAQMAAPLHMPSANKARPLQYPTPGATGITNPGGGYTVGMNPKWGQGMVPIGYDPRQAFPSRPPHATDWQTGHGDGEAHSPSPAGPAAWGTPSQSSTMDWQGGNYDSGASSSKDNMQSGAAKGHRRQDDFADMCAREGVDYSHYSSAEDAGGSSMSIPPEPTKSRGSAKDRWNSRDKRGG